jgi:competence protein ComEC
MTAGAAWVGALAGWTGGGWSVAALGVAATALAALALRWPEAMVAGLCGAAALLAAISAWAAVSRVEATLGAALETGPLDVAGRVADQPVIEGGLARFVLADGRTAPEASPLVPIGVEMSAEPPQPGTSVRVRGWLDPGPTRIRGDPVGGVLRRAELVAVTGSRIPVIAVGNALRARVARGIGEGRLSARRALLAGFLVGDTSRLPAADVDALRDAGLSHFVAVSGSNVALFLIGWWLVLVPLAGPRVRAVVGLVGIAVFVVITRWEPSVVRAGVMIGLVLAGRLVAVPVEPAVALSAAVTGLLFFAGDLAVHPGFQLSVAATAGVILGARRAAVRRPRWLWSTLGATIAAQAAVLPFLLWHFGSVPLGAPLANVLAAPLVTAATAIGGMGVLLGWEPLVGLGATLAGGVLAVARAAAPWPQLGPAAAAVTVAVGVAARRRSWRPVLALGAGAALAITALPGVPPPGASVTFLSVGQGDAIIVRDGDDTMLVDGGRDPRVLEAGLRRHGLGSVDLLVVSHGDVDHVGGLEGFFDRRGASRLWVPDQPSLGAALEGLIEAAALRGVPVERVGRGATYRVGTSRVSVVGPPRRYQGDNDGSIVLWIDGGSTQVLLPADAEAVAQRDMPAMQPDVMLVPHHGSATTDLEWLADTVGPLAVISVGPNPYGHPSAAVLAALRDQGARVITTQEAGDVVVALRSP